MRHNSHRHLTVDNPRRWNNEKGYYSGLGDGEIMDTGTTFVTDALITPSGDATRQSSGSGSSWVDAFTAALPAVAGIIAQRDYNKTNLALINSGKPPLSPQQYVMTNPQTGAVVTPTGQIVAAPSGPPKLVLYIGGALLIALGLRAAKVI